MNLRFKNESGIIRVLKHCAPLHTEQDLEDMGGNNFVFFFFFFLDRAFSIMKTKINQQNAKINSGLIYY